MEDNSEIGASGRRRSGKARMSALTPEERTELAKKAAGKRWSSDQPIHEPEAWGDLQISGCDVPCAVLVVNGEVVRVVSERGLMKAFGGRRSGGSHWLRSRGESEVDLPAIISAANLRSFISPELSKALSERFLYKSAGRTGSIAHGIRGELIAMICEVLLEARDKDKLLPGQEEAAKAAYTLMRGLARTAIAALIDEATGYQEQRPPDALRKILEAFIAKELQPYVPTFESDYYEHLFRLRGLDFKRDSVQRPQYFGWLTNDIIYKRLAPCVLAELKKLTVRNEDGRPKHKYFQRLTANRGYPKLREHLGAVVATMKLSTDYADFIRKLDTHYPRYGQTYALPFDFDPNKDTGTGI